MSAQGGAMPREVFIQNNLGLAHACAGRFKNRGMEYDELYAAACLGLVKAYDGFDWSRGVCFSTYAVPVILGEIKKLFRNGGTVKVSRSIKELGLKINARREQCLKQTGCEPTVGELAQALNTTPEQMKMFLTRIGFGSRAIITGDITQIDLPSDTKSGLKESMKILKNIDDIAFCNFTEKDVVRHPLVQKIIKAYEKYDENQERKRNFKCAM